MKGILQSIIIISILSCNETQINKKASDLQIRSLPEIIIVPRDTCINVLNECLHRDSCIYERFYDDTRLDVSYVRTGNFIFDDKLSGIIIYTPTDSTIAIEHFIKEDDAWQPIDKKTDIPATWLIFETDNQDYNFDGINDAYINVGVQMGGGLPFGYILTINEKGKFKFHPESLGVKNMDPDPKRKIIRANSTEFCKGVRVMCDEIYKWKKDSLTLIKRTFNCIE
jgi:hypothetical protein